MGDFAYIGSRTIGASLPMVAIAQANLAASIGSQMSTLEAKIAGTIKAQARIAVSIPTLAAQLEAALKIVANIRTLISMGLTLPTVSVSGMASLLAQLKASLGLLQASLAFSVELGTLLASAGVYAWTYEGAVGGLVPGGIPGEGSSQPVWGIVLAAGAGAAQTSLKTMFGVSVG
jgi:hypothetical protein